MKKLLSMLGAIGLVATSSASVVACGSKAGNNDTNGPSKDDIAKWDEMGIDEFEALFKETITNATTWTGEDEFDRIIGDPALWTVDDSNKFVTWFNEHLDIKAFNLIKYGKDKIKNGDSEYDLWGADKDDGLETIYEFMDSALGVDSNVKSLTTNISFTEWKNMVATEKPTL